MAELDGGWTVGDAAPAQRPLIIDRISLTGHLRRVWGKGLWAAKERVSESRCAR